jgi:hypothetical protein
MDAAIEQLVRAVETATREYRASQPQARIHLELIEQRTEYGGSYLTVIDHGRGTFADKLASDEALGVVAQALMGPRELPRLRYMETYADWAAWERRYRAKDEPYPEPVALLTCSSWAQR